MRTRPYSQKTSQSSTAVYIVVYIVVSRMLRILIMKFRPSEDYVSNLNKICKLNVA